MQLIMNARFLLLTLALTFGMNTRVVLAQAARPYIPKNATEKAVLSSVRRDVVPTPIVTRLVVANPYAMYTWVMGDRTGQTILKQDRFGQWQIIQGSTGAFDVRTMVTLGIPRNTAEHLFKAIRRSQ
jgi:hypothetical protein